MDANCFVKTSFENQSPCHIAVANWHFNKGLWQLCSIETIPFPYTAWVFGSPRTIQVIRGERMGVFASAHGRPAEYCVLADRGRAVQLAFQEWFKIMPFSLRSKLQTVIEGGKFHTDEPHRADIRGVMHG